MTKLIQYILFALVLLFASCMATDVTSVALSDSDRIIGAKELIRQRLKNEQPELGRYMPSLYGADTLTAPIIQMENGTYESGSWRFVIDPVHVDCVFRHLYGGDGRFEVHELRVLIGPIDGSPGIQKWVPRHIQGGKN